MTDKFHFSFSFFRFNVNCHLLQVHNSLPSTNISARWSPDGSMIAVLRSCGTILLLDARWSATPLPRFPPFPEAVSFPPLPSLALRERSPFGGKISAFTTFGPDCLLVGLHTGVCRLHLWTGQLAPEAFPRTAPRRHDGPPSLEETSIRQLQAWETRLGAGMPRLLLVGLYEDDTLLLSTSGEDRPADTEKPLEKQLEKQLEEERAEKQGETAGKDGWTTRGLIKTCSCFAFSPVQSLLAVGQLSGELLLYRLDLLSFDLTLVHRLSLDFWQLLDTGAISCLSWSPDHRALAAGSRQRGVTVWAPVSGSRLFSTASHGHSHPHPPSGAPASMEAVIDHMLDRGVKSLCWGPQGTALLVAPARIIQSSLPSECFFSLPLCRTLPGAVVCSPPAHQRLFLQAGDRFLIWSPTNAQLSTPPDHSTNTTQFFSTPPSSLASSPDEGQLLTGAWQHLQFPQPYLFDNWPMRVACFSPTQRMIMIAGRRGFAVYDAVRVRWCCFQRRTEEQSFTCHAALWLSEQRLLVATTSGELRLYDPSQLASLIGDSTLKKARWVEDELSFISNHQPSSSSSSVEKLSSSFSPSSSSETPSLLPPSDELPAYLQTVGSCICIISHDGQLKLLDGDTWQPLLRSNIKHVFLDPLQVAVLLPQQPPPLLSLSDLTALQDAVSSGTPERVSERIKSLRVVIHQSSGFLSVVAPQAQFQTGLRGGSELVLPFADPSSPGQQALLDFGAHGLHLWRDVCGDPSVLQIAEFSPDQLPVGVFPQEAIVVALKQVMQYGHAESAHPSIPKFGFYVRAQPFLHCLLSQELRSARPSAALQLCTPFRALPHFPISLEILVYQALDHNDQSLLRAVVAFIRAHFAPLYVRSVVNCARKLDPSFWPGLFLVAGNPADLFDAAVAHRDLSAAAGSLRIIQHEIGVLVSRRKGLVLAKHVRAKGDAALAKDLLRFIAHKPDLHAPTPEELDIEQQISIELGLLGLSIS